MALILSAATGNFNAGATWVGGIVPGAADEARASTTHVITITADVTCTEISNAGTGTYVLNSGVTLTANVTNKSLSTSTLLTFSAATPASGSIIGNCTGGSVVNTVAAANTSSGTLNITGNCLATIQFCYGANNSSTGTLNITGNCTGGGLSQQAHGASNNSTGTLNITGNCTGGTSPSGSGSFGAFNGSTGTLSITGNCTGGSGASCAGVSNASSGTLSIVGSATGGSIASAAGANNASTGQLNITGTATGGTAGIGATNASSGTLNATRAKGNGYGPGSAGLTAAVGVANSALGVVSVEELEYGTLGMSPTSGAGIRLKKLTSNVAIFNYANTVGSKTLVDATQGQMPAITDVRFGTSYASGALTGVAYIPAAASVAFGVPTDNTTGTATLTAADVRAAIGLATANLDAQLSTISTKASEVHAIHGLDLANALTVTPTSRTSGAITQAITGDGTTNTVVTRV